MEHNTSINHKNGNDANCFLVAVPFTEIKVGDEILIGENQFDKVDEIDTDDYSVVLKELGWNFSPDDDGNYLVRHCHQWTSVWAAAFGWPIHVVGRGRSPHSDQ